MALGARRARVAALVFVHIARMALVGHDPGAHWCTSPSRSLSSFLYGTSLRDPLVFTGSIVAIHKE